MIEIQEALNAAFGVHVEVDPNCRNHFTFKEELTPTNVHDVVNSLKSVEWQDPKSPDCNNNDGILYVMMQVDWGTDGVTDLMVGVDCNEKMFYTV